MAVMENAVVVVKKFFGQVSSIAATKCLYQQEHVKQTNVINLVKIMEFA
jgi:hypothetical protein